MLFWKYSTLWQPEWKIIWTYPSLNEGIWLPSTPDVCRSRHCQNCQRQMGVCELDWHRPCSSREAAWRTMASSLERPILINLWWNQSSKHLVERCLLFCDRKLSCAVEVATKRFPWNCTEQSCGWKRHDTPRGALRVEQLAGLEASWPLIA